MAKQTGDRVPADVRRLFEEMQAGDEAAGWRLIMRLCHLARPVIRRHLDRRVRRFVDSTDVMQNILLAAAKFMNETMAPEGRFADAYELLIYVEGIARKQTLMTNRQYLDVKKRGDAGFEVLSQVEGELRAPAGNGPLDDAMAHELLTRLGNLAEPMGSIVTLRLRGWTRHAIAAGLGLDEHAVRRLLQRARDLTNLEERHLKTDAPEPPAERDFPALPPLTEEMSAVIGEAEPDGVLMILDLRRDGRSIRLIGAVMNCEMVEVEAALEKVRADFPGAAIVPA